MAPTPKSRGKNEIRDTPSIDVRSRLIRGPVHERRCGDKKPRKGLMGRLDERMPRSISGDSPPIPRLTGIPQIVEARRAAGLRVRVRRRMIGIGRAVGAHLKACLKPQGSADFPDLDRANRGEEGEIAHHHSSQEIIPWIPSPITATRPRAIARPSPGSIVMARPDAPVSVTSQAMS